MTQALSQTTSVSNTGVGCEHGPTANGAVKETSAANLGFSGRDHVIWAIMLEHVNCGEVGQVRRLSDEMREAGATRSSYASVAALRACSRLRDLKGARQIHADVIQAGF